MRIQKFGGSSLATPDRIRAVAGIVLDTARRERPFVVVSALQGVTDQLIDAATRAERGDENYVAVHEALQRRHLGTVADLFGKRPPRAVLHPVEAMLKELGEVLHGIYLLRDCSRHSLDLTVSFGERLSSVILAAYLRRSHPSIAADAREFILADDHTDPSTVLFDETNKRIRSHFRKLDRHTKEKPIPVITGYIGATAENRTTTLGRDGSDYSAAIVGAAMKASRIEIWTDVDGVMSADPRAVPAAFPLPELSYEEAMELSYFGASVLHAAAIAPAIAKRIPLHIKNTMNPSAPGTLVSAKATGADSVAKGISSVDGITLLTLRGPGMVGVPGTAERLFRSLAAGRVNVVLISQASSEHTICFAVRGADVERARRSIQDEFHHELASRHLFLDRTPDQTVVAVVGEGMKGTPGVSGKVFQALGEHHVNVSAIAQGASERNISFVTDTHHKSRALRVIHQAFFERKKRLWLFVIGVGNVGKALLDQLQAQRDDLLDRGFDVRLLGVSNSRRFVLDPDGVDAGAWEDRLKSGSEPLDLPELAARIDALGLTNAALVDCTASADVVRAYPAFIRADMHVLTPNKLANVLPLKRYHALMDLVAERNKHFLFEANVGAGMPIISTLLDLIASGDNVHRVEGIFSGTLSYLFNHFDGTRPFSELVREAHGLGFTEPDPREDLSGQDVARKLLILARLLGHDLDLKNIQVESLVPSSLRRGAFSPGFYDAFVRADAMLAKRNARARKAGRVLRYVGTFGAEGARAGLQEFAADHPFAGTRGSDNVIAFTTARYSRTPLVLQGPGAGADVTAMGVFSDILKLLNYLPY